MNWEFTPYAIPLFVSALIVLGEGIYSLLRLNVRGAALMVCLAGSVLTYVVGYAFEIGSPTLSAMRPWMNIQYFGTTTSPLIVVLMISAYVGKRYHRNPLLYLILLAVPVTTQLFAWTNEQHSLIWRDLRIVTSAPPYIVDFSSGPWYWVHILYTWLMIGYAFVLLLRTYRQVHGLHRQQIRFFLIGISAPMAANIVYLSRILPIKVDPIPFAMLIAAVVFAWAIFNYRLLDITPAARQSVFDNMIDAVIVLDSKERVADLNQAARALFGFEVESILGQSAKTVFRAWPAIQTIPPISEMAIEQFGRKRHFDVSFSILRTRSGRTEGYNIVLREITARVEAEIALRTSRDLLARLRDVDAALNRHLDLRYVAEIALQAAMDMSAADSGLIGLADESGVHVVHTSGIYHEQMKGTVIPQGRGITNRAMETRESQLVLDVKQDKDYLEILPSTRAEMALPMLSGEKLVGIINLETSTPDSFTEGVFGTLKLLATRAATAIDNAVLYESRDRLVKELDAYARTVAHDLKNPLSVIVGYSALVLEEDETLQPDERREYLKIIRSGAEKADNIVRSLLLLAGVRVATKVELGPLNMTKIVDDACGRLKESLHQAKAELIKPESWPEVFGFASWVEEIWVNYISNALKYGGRPPRIELGSDQCSEGSLRFWVRDNGKGLTEKQQAALFMPFTRLEPTMAEGHGLGLSIVQRIAERLNGEVGVISEPGKGSTFYFTLPRGSSVLRPIGTPLTPDNKTGD